MATDGCRQLFGLTDKPQQTPCKGTPEEVSSHCMGLSSLPATFSSSTILCYSHCFWFPSSSSTHCFCASFTSILNISKSMEGNNSKSHSDRRKSISAKARMYQKPAPQFQTLPLYLSKRKQLPRTRTKPLPKQVQDAGPQQRRTTYHTKPIDLCLPIC